MIQPRERSLFRTHWARRVGAFAAVAACALAVAGPAGSYVTTGRTIWSIAGTGFGCGTPTGLCGDGTSSIDAYLTSPTGAAVAADGTVYIADTGNNRIRRVTTDGGISTIAGTGATCSSATSACGDGGAAKSGQLSSPSAVAVGGDGSVYFADTGTHRVRRVSANGVLSTVAGSGVLCSSGTSPCGDGGAAISAQLRSPRGVAVAPDGAILVADTGDNRIRRVFQGVISASAGDGTICSSAGATCGDGGPSTTAQFNNPSGLAFDSAGTLYVADRLDNRIRRILSGGAIDTIAGNGGPCPVTTDRCGDGGSAVAGNLTRPNGVAVSGGTVYITDTDAHKIRRVSNGIISTIAGTGTDCYPKPACGDGGSATAATLDTPGGITVDASGSVFIADTGDHVIRWLTGPGSTPNPPGGGGTTTTQPTVTTDDPPTIQTTPVTDTTPPATTPRTTTVPVAAPKIQLVRCSGSTCKIVSGAQSMAAKLRKQAKSAQKGPKWNRVELRRSGKTYASGMGKTLAEALTLVPQREVKPGQYRLKLTEYAKGKQSSRNRVIRIK